MVLTKDRVEAAIDRFVELGERLEGFNEARDYFVRSSQTDRLGGPFSTKPIAALALNLRKPQQLNGGFGNKKCAASLLHNAGFIITDKDDNSITIECDKYPFLIRGDRRAKACASNYNLKNLPQSTQAERMVAQRIGQDIFRDRLLEDWKHCPLTGITDNALLRASHIKPWKDCNDDQRLDKNNGLLLSALWDAAFDRGLVTFGDDGKPRFARSISRTAREKLGHTQQQRIPLNSVKERRSYLAWHREHVFKH